MTVVIIILILLLLVIAVTSRLRAKAEAAKCTSNLRSLGIAANAYLQDQSHWPQIDPLLLKNDRERYARDWVEILRPYGLTEQNWICPTTQRAMGNPDFTKPENARVDYLAMPFDRERSTPTRWARHPWFIERGDVHGNGNLLLLSNGQVQSVGDYYQKR